MESLVTPPFRSETVINTRYWPTLLQLFVAVFVFNPLAVQTWVSSKSQA